MIEFVYFLCSMCYVVWCVVIVLPSVSLSGLIVYSDGILRVVVSFSVDDVVSVVRGRYRS